MFKSFASIMLKFGLISLANTLLAKQSLNNGNRIYFMDNARALASIIGLFYHCMYVFAKPWHININHLEQGSQLYAVVDYLNSFRMPMFLIFAGFFSAYMIRKYQEATFLQKRFKRIVLPFISAVVLLIPFQLFVELKYKYNQLWLNHFWDMVNPLSQLFSLMHLWFLYHIILYSDMLVLAYWLMKRLKLTRYAYKTTSNRWIDLIIWMLIGYIFYRSGKIIDISFKLHSPWLSFNDIGVNFPFFLFGLHFYLNRDVYEKGLISGTNLSILIYLLASILCFIFDQMIDDFSSIFITVTKWLHVLLVLNVFKRILNYTSSTLNYFSNASYAVYILHQPVIVVVSYFAVRYFDAGFFYLNYFMLVAMSLMATYFVYELLVRRFTFGRILLTGTSR